MTISDLDSVRTVYEATALTTVVCQLRFDPVLRISAEIPVAFQEAVRDRFPQYVSEESLGLRLGPSEGAISTNRSAVHCFRGEQAVLRLASNFISLETATYGHFGEFFAMLDSVRKSAEELYRVREYTRVGLRFINVFDAQRFPTPWDQWISRRLLGPLFDDRLGDSIVRTDQFFVITEDDWAIGVRHGLSDDGYKLDLDHFTEKPTNPMDIEALLKTFSVQSFKLFRWSITDQTHEAMRPRDE